MKLPQVQYRPVQSLGRADTNAVAAKANSLLREGEVFQNAMNQIANVSANYIERQENAEFNETIAAYNIELSDWQSKHNAKQFYTAEEIGEGISEEEVPRVITGTDDQGMSFSEFRTNIPAYEVYPRLLKQKLEGMIKDKAAKISNPGLRNAFLEKAGADAATLMMRATVSAEEAQQTYLLEVGKERAKKAAENGQLALAEFVIENLETDELAKKKMRDQAENLVEIFEVTQAIRSNDPETGLTMRSILEDPQYSGSFDEGQRQAAIGDLNARLTQLAAEGKAEMSKQHESFISDANAGIDEGTFTLQDVEAGYKRWHTNEVDPRSISGRERTALRARINARNARLKNTKDLVSIGEGLISNGGDTYDSEHQKAIDAYVADKGVRDLRELERITVRSSIMPQVLENFLNTAALHDAENGSEDIGMAAELYGRLSDMKPEVIRELGKESKNVLGDTHILVRGNMAVPDAYAMARENARIKPELRETRERDYRELKAIDENPDILDQFMDDDDSFFGFETTFFNQSAVKPTQVMQSQFDTHAYMHYLRTGDIALSRKRAWQDIKEKWSPTGIGVTVTADGIERGVRAMEYAPERLMAVSTEVAKQRLEAFARANTLNADNLVITSDDRTARDGSWAVWTVDPDTDEMVFFPERWVGIDWKADAEKYTYNAAVDAAIKEKAEQERIDMEMYEMSLEGQLDKAGVE